MLDKNVSAGDFFITHFSCHSNRRETFTSTLSTMLILFDGPPFREEKSVKREIS